MINRRDFFAGSAAAAVAGVVGARAIGADGQVANAEKISQKVIDAFYEPRGKLGLYERLPSLDVQSRLHFYTGYRAWMAESLRKSATSRSKEVLQSNGIDPSQDAPLEHIVSLLTSDPTVAMYMHNWQRTQEAMWRHIKNACDRRADMYLEQMWKAESQGPGTLELRPESLHIPDYACYEIHIQPGGYVGDRFAGHIYYHGTATVIGGPQGNYQDQMQAMLAPAVPVPADGKVRRILDQGTGCGQFAYHLKKRFPDAEVWGNDVAGPMLRFAHMRSVKLGAEIHYMQELAEDSHFPDEHFDIVTNNLLIHEVPAHKVREIVAEAYRTLRSGGVFYPLDSYTGDQPRNTALAKYYAWRNFRWNHEVWWMEYYDLDLAEAMRKAGFKVIEDGPKARGDTTRNIVGYKV